MNAQATPEENALHIAATRRYRASFAVTFSCLGLASFMITTYLICSAGLGDPELEAMYKAEVNPETYSFPMVAFFTAFCLNFATLLFERESTKFQLALLACYINLTAGFTSFLHYQGYAVIVRGLWGHPTLILRLNMYLHATPAMVYLISVISDFSRSKVLVAMVADSLIMATAIIAELCTVQWFGVLMYVICYLLFFYVIHMMWTMFDAALREAGSETIRINLLVLRSYAVGLWFLFPLLWITHRLGVIPLGIEEWLLCTGDLLGKAVFSSSLMVGNFLTIDQRRLIAMHIVEEGNRIRVIEELKELVTQKEDFLSSVSHELRTPLNGIIGLSEAMLMGTCGELRESVSKNVKTIKLSGSRLLALVNDILDAAAMKKCTLAIKHQRVNLSTVTDDVISLCQPLARRGVRLVNSVAETFPAVFGDTGRLIQIFHNLVGNSCKFTSSGVISINAQFDVKTKEATVSVTDSGIGIPAGRFEAIFDPYEQVDSKTSQKYGGTGLGLNLVKSLVEAHSGKISVVSTIGVGTSMYFTLKLWDETMQDFSDDAVNVAALENSSAVQVAAPTPTAAAGKAVPILGSAVSQLSAVLKGRAMGKHLVVLSVDDDPAQQGIIELVLPPAGFKVVTCMDGESALALLSDEANIPDAILLDVNMPGMSGYEVCRKLRHLSYLAYTPILMVSANSDEGHIVEGLSAGCNDYILKPFGHKEIVERLNTHIDVRDRMRENGDADGRICVRNLESDTKTGRLLSNSNSTSTLFSLPRSVKSELEKSTGANKTVRPYEHLSMVMIGISNLDVVVQHLSPGGIASALTSMYIYLDELLVKYNCYKLDTIEFSTICVVAGLSSESPSEHANNALSFSEELMDLAKQITISDGQGHLELTIGIHTGATEGIIMGCNHPVLHFTGSLPSHAAQLQATCPPGCIQVSQALCRALGGDSGKFVAVSSSKSHSTFFRKLGNYQEALPLMTGVLDSYLASHPFGPVNTGAERLRPIQLAFLTLTQSHPGLLVNLLAGVTAPAPLFRTASTSAPSVADFLNMLDSDLTHKSDDPGAPRDSPQEYQVAKVQYEKEELQKQLEEVSQETCRLQEMVEQMELVITHKSVKDKTSQELIAQLESSLRDQETTANLAEIKVAMLEKQLSLDRQPTQSPSQRQPTATHLHPSMRASADFSSTRASADAHHHLTLGKFQYSGWSTPGARGVQTRESMTIKYLLSEIGLEAIVPRFEEEGITPAMLPHVDDAKLRMLGVASVGKRLRLRLMAKKALGV